MIRIALGQVDTTVGDLEGNVDLLTAWASRATEAGANVIVFPELAVTGYPPEDLVLRPAFVEDNLEALQGLAAATKGGSAIVTGFVDRTETGIHNAAALLAGGEVIARYHKVKLPNYGVFDERRTFVPGEVACPVRVGDSELGLSVCEDAWMPGPPFDAYAERHTPIVLNINGSPYHRGKAGERLEICRDRARETAAWIVYVNAVGGQDELVFDGGSLVVSPDGEARHRAAVFEEDLLIVDLDEDRSGAAERSPWPSDPEEVYRALVLGLRDYVRKNGFDQVVLGLSGGIDSSLVAVLASDALGSGHVRALAMPSRFTSDASLEDAAELARRCGFALDTIGIDEVFAAYLDTLEEPFRRTRPDVTEENLQARIRGNLLMAISNKFGSLVLATGNKSEYAVGYATLYGDMAGGFAPIKDVPKTLVYELARWRNARDAEGEGPIPERVLTKPPSAELRADQRDTDSLPSYEVLDPIVEAYVQDDRSPEDIVSMGHDVATVRRVVAMIDGAEYKRRQAAPGIKITPKAFGRDRRIPITNRYRRRLRIR
ncbi:MAG TPA: NAD+ synthase [Actinomycetota bacterium]|jgi:NAD+ synthase (glutamine-hydrolysing)|nr:NAD+ synthase [Actinomycetota bacterium]